MDIAPTPFPYLEMTPKELFVFNLLFGQQRVISFEFKKQSYKLKFIPFEQDFHADIHFKLKLDQKIIWAGLQPSLPIEMFEPSLAGVDIEDLPPDVSSLLVGSLGEGLIKALEKGLGTTCHLEATTFTQPHEPFDFVLLFTIQEGERQDAYKGYLALSEYSLEFLLDKFQKVRPLSVDQWGKAPILTRIELGSTVLTKKDYKNIGMNDIVLLDELDRFRNNHFKMIVSPQLAYDFQYNNGQATILKMTDIPPDTEEETYEDDELQDLDEVLETEEETSSSEQDATPHAGHARAEARQAAPEPASSVIQTKLDDLPIKLVFEVGQKQMFLNQLKAIDTGYTFELDNPLDKPVIVRANGASVGMGELVQVGNKVGVRILEFNP